MKAKFYKIEDIIIMELETETAFEYYVRDNRHFFEASFGVEKLNRFSKNDLKDLYHSGYFDSELERD